MVSKQPKICFLRVKVEDDEAVQMFDPKQKLGYLVKLI
jgi:hypothetical protein